MIQTAPAQYYIFNWSADRKDNLNGFIIEYGFQSHFDSLKLSLPKYKTVIDSNGFEHKKMVRGHKNPVSNTKINKLKQVGVDSLIEIDADWILNQTKIPSQLKYKRLI